MGLLGKPTILGNPQFLTVRFLQSHLPILQGFFIFSRVRAPLKIIQMLRFLRRLVSKAAKWISCNVFPSKCRVLVWGDTCVYLVYFHFREMKTSCSFQSMPVDGLYEATLHIFEPSRLGKKLVSKISDLKMRGLGDLRS